MIHLPVLQPNDRLSGDVAGPVVVHICDHAFFEHTMFMGLLRNLCLTSTPTGPNRVI